jgi:hypothetical protein
LQFVAPVCLERRWANDQDALDIRGGVDQANGFYSFAEPHFVAYKCARMT